MAPPAAAAVAPGATMKLHLPSGAPFLMELPLAHYLASGYQMYRRCLFSHASVASFLNASEAFLLRLLSFYNPTLPAAQRVSAAWPLMRPADLVIVVFTYLAFVVSVLIVHGLATHVRTPLLLCRKQERQQQLQDPVKQKHEGENPQQKCQEQKKGGKKTKHPLFEKIGVTLVIQTIYNVLQVCICSYVVHQTVVVFAREGYTLTFNKFDPSRTSMAEIVWLFYLTKVFDLADTLLIVWRRKWNQFSFLHVYHHASIIYMMWINASVAYDGDIYFAILANASVHVVMYTYYLMASLSLPVASKMKKFVTQGQMTQFLCMLFQGVYHSFFYYACEYPFRVAIGYMLYITSMYLLFAQFSKKTYGTRTRDASTNDSDTDHKSSSSSSSKLTVLESFRRKVVSLVAAADAPLPYPPAATVAYTSEKRTQHHDALPTSPAAAVLAARAAIVSIPTSVAAAGAAPPSPVAAACPLLAEHKKKN